MTIDILCRVVDNYGDIGVAYRLAKALGETDPALTIRLVVDDLNSFRALAPSIDPNLAVQSLNGWTVVAWDHPWQGFRDEAPHLALECFACGRPEFFEACLFDPARAQVAHIVNVEHLTAEPWADEFHLMPSLTRSARVKKWIFMPGFTAATGGLILDRGFLGALARWKDEGERPALRRGLAQRAGLALEPGHERRFWVSCFSYERDYAPTVRDLAEFGEGRPILVLAAAGKSQACFLRAWEEAGKPFPAIALPFLPQELWDEALLACDASIVRGEESLARAALAGRPFLWQAYLQAEAHHLVKVRAFLDRLRPHFGPAAFPALEDAFLGLNDRPLDGPSCPGGGSIRAILEADDHVRLGFSSFADSLLRHGDLAARLLTFLRDLV